MNEHPNDEILANLDQLERKNRTKVILHLSGCEECRKKTPIPTKEEMLRAIFGDTDDVFEQF